MLIASQRGSQELICFTLSLGGTRRWVQVDAVEAGEVSGWACLRGAVSVQPLQVPACCRADSAWSLPYTCEQLPSQPGRH